MCFSPSPHKQRDWERLVTWRSGDATHKEIMETLVPEHDAIIHSIGIMFGMPNWFDPPLPYIIGAVEALLLCC